MIEGEAPEEAWKLIEDGAQAPTEDIVAEGLEAARRAIDELIDLQEEFLRKRGVEPQPWDPAPLFEGQVGDAVRAFAGDRIQSALVPAKLEREANLAVMKDELKAHLLEEWGQDLYDERAAQVGPAFKDLE